MYIDKKALDLLRRQSKKLYELSTTMDTWQQSKYGSQLRFCDSATLVDARKMWKFYSTEQKGAEVSRLIRRFEVALEKTKSMTADRGANSGTYIVTGIRSAIPAHTGALEDLSNLSKHYWKYKSTELNASIRASAKHPNPAFLTLEDEGTLHYGTDPLLGFHLATAYAPLRPDDPLFNQLKGLPQLERVVAVARMEFYEWIASYRQHIADIRVRFFIGDAVSFAHTLQHKRITKASTANWYRNQYHLEPLVLDGPDYASGVAPLEFDVIDTSNLCDHIGSLILLVAASPLLRNHISSVLYTEIIVKHHKTYREALDNMLCGHVPTLSTLFGLFPVEYWTNTSSLSFGDEMLPGALLDETTKNPIVGAQGRQMFLRTCWKRPVFIDVSSGPGTELPRIRFNANQLAHVLYQVYVNMFINEDYVLKLSNISLESIRKSSLVWYHRASFASFLRLVQTRVTCDWDTVMDDLIVLIENRPNAPMGMNYIQELYVYLHMLGVFSSQILKKWYDRGERNVSWMFAPIVPRITPIGEIWGDLRDWKTIPPVVCVTLKVPRKKLSVFTDMSPSTLGSPNVHCVVQSSRSTWQNLFPACQLAFGDISTSGEAHDDSFAVSVADDGAGWKGNSALIVSFYAPAYFLLLEPREATVAFGIHGSPVTTSMFLPKLGMAMNVYETTLANSAAVYITRYAPNQTGFPVAPGFHQTTPASPVKIGADFSLTASVNQETGHIATFTGRLDIKSDDYKSVLAAGCRVQKSVLSPCQVAIQLGQSAPLTTCFPVFTVEATQKTRIARKSSYVEVIAQVADSSEWAKDPYYMYPVHLQDGKPTNWNMPYLDLQRCPIIDTDQRSNLNWLLPHLSLAMSARERALRENDRLPRSDGERLRLDFKESLFSTLVQSAGLQGHVRQAYGLHIAGSGGGIHILVLPSNLRLDLANRTAVLDCAVLPLHKAIMPELRHFLAALPRSSQGLCQIHANDAELRLWKHLLPAYVERCRRTWTHREDCGYARTGKIPLTVEPAQPFLCACGNGKFPPNFLRNVAHWDIASRHAVRAAISPAFWAPFADDVYLPEIGGSRPPHQPCHDGCAACGKTKTEDGAGLLKCARCMEVKYCSRECQRSDWKAHKAVCK